MRRTAGSVGQIEKLERQGKWQAAERLLLQELANAGHNRLLTAQCYSNLGNIAETQNRIGDAFRHWSMALDLLNRLDLAETAEAIRLRRLIRLWHENPRVWVSYSHRDQKRVEAVLKVVRRAGIEVKYDQEFAAGHSIQRQVLTAISLCPKHVVFWSGHSRNSGWISYEREILEIVKKQRQRDRSIEAWDNITIFYCLGRVRPDNEMRSDLQIVEPKLGFALATSTLIHSIKFSEILSNS
jgi:hypothetical protein